MVEPNPRPFELGETTHKRHSVVYLTIITTKKAPRRVLVVSSLIVQSPVDRITDPDVEDQGQVAVEWVTWCILGEANPDPVDVVEKVLIEPSHVVSRVDLLIISTKKPHRRGWVDGLSFGSDDLIPGLVE